MLWHGSQPIPGAATAVNSLLGAGHSVLFATNNSSATVGQQEAKLGRFGVEASGMILSSAMAAGSLIGQGEQVFVLGGQGIVDAVTERGGVCVPVSDPALGPPQLDAVIVGIDFTLTYERLAMAVRAIRNGARFIATNHDPTFPTEHGLSVGGGAIVAAVRTAAETEPIIAGKPHQPMADLAIAMLGSEGLMIGDRDDTDGAFARTAGYRFGMVLSGVTSAEEAAALEPAPDVIAADVAELLFREMGVG